MTCTRCEDVHTAQKAGKTQNECKCSCHDINTTWTSTGGNILTNSTDAGATTTALTIDGTNSLTFNTDDSGNWLQATTTFDASDTQNWTTTQGENHIHTNCDCEDSDEHADKGCNC